MAVNVVIEKLKFGNKKIPIGRVGSIFRAGSVITDSLIEVVHRFAPKAFLADPLLQPASAAARMAFEMPPKSKNH